MGEIFLGNIKGQKGDTGSGLRILEFYDTVEALSSAVPNPSNGDAYGVGSEAPYDIYIYSAKKGWVNNGALAPDINEQTPNYAEATRLEPLTSGEKISLAFGKIKKAINELISHLGNKNNPHNVNASQVGALAKTISNTNADILEIEEDGWYYCYSAVNVPTIVKNGYLKVCVSTSKYRVVYWRAANSHIEYVNVFSDGKWIGWVEGLTSKGGTLNGNLYVYTDSYPTISFGKDSNNRASIVYTINNHADLNNYYEGTATTLSLMNEKVTPLSGLLKLWTNNGTDYAIYGEHNKPKKDYTGTGSTSQTVDIGGVGNAVIVISQSGYGGFITPSGAFGFVWVNGAGNNFQTTPNAKYANGKLTFSGDSWLNTSGVAYTAYVI